MPEKEPGPALPIWVEDLRPGAEGSGFLEKNLRHSLMFVKRPGDRLLVTFDNLSNVSDDSVARLPWAYKFARDNAHSHLGVMAHVSDWYRDGALIARLQALAAQGFFDGHARVVFAGVSMGAYAALAFSSLVPGAHVIAINPQSTLDPDIVPWETRYEKGRRQDWSLPLGDGAALTAGAARVNIFHDPYHALDQKHVDRLAGDNVRVFKCWFSRHKTAVFLRKIGALKAVMTHVLMDDLTEADFYALYRARRNLPWYRGSVSGYFRAGGREEVAAGFDQAFRRRQRARSAQDDAAPGTADAPAPEGAHTAAPEGADTAAPEGADTAAPEGADTAAPEGADTAAPEGVGTTAPGGAEATAPEGAEATAPAAPAETPAEERTARIRPPRNAGRPQAPAGSRVIVTTMKNEGPFMLEWVAYNRLIGFTGFLIYTNDCDDGTDLIAARLEALGLAQHRRNPFKPGGSPQRGALRDARGQDLVRTADWLICADCDEFLNVRVGGRRLDDLFAAVGEADAISVCWKLFGNSGRLEYSDDPVIAQFDRACPEHEYPNYRALGMKTLVRNNDRFRKLRIHRPAFHLDRGDVAWVDGGGRPMPDLYLEQGWKAFEGFSHDYARLHHYAVRSVDSFLVKRDRGRTNHVEGDQGISYWSNMNYNADRDSSLQDMLPGLRAEMARLLGDAELARLHAAAIDWHRGKIDELRRRDGWEAFRDTIAAINAAPDPQKA